MRLYRYSGRSGARIAVAIGDGRPVDPGPLGAIGSSTRRLIEAGPRALEELRVAARSAPPVPDGARWLCPLDEASSLRDFLAFESHVKLGAQRRGTDVPRYWNEVPVYYKGNHRSLIGPNDECPWPPYTNYLDFELELAMIVARRGRDVGAADATGFIFGFTIMNDFSARDVQAKEMSAWLGPAKAKDFATALGPCIVTADDIGPDPDLDMICRVDGEEWGRARSGEMSWSWGDMLAHVSAGEDVFPCDVYGSGTPGGCCGLDLGRKLHPGAVVELEVEGIGVLRNRIGFPRNL